MGLFGKNKKKTGKKGRNNKKVPVHLTDRGLKAKAEGPVQSGQSVSEESSPWNDTFLDKIKRFVGKYRVQVYGFVLVSVVAILAVIIALVSKPAVEKKDALVEGLQPPVFQPDRGTIVEYDFGSVSWDDSAARTYSVETELMPKVVSAAGSLGIQSEPEEDLSTGQYTWSNDQHLLSFIEAKSLVRYHGKGDLVWGNEQAVIDGVAELFSLNPENLEVVSKTEDDKHRSVVLGYKIDGLPVYIDGTQNAIDVFSDLDGSVIQFDAVLVETIGAAKVDLLQSETVREGIMDANKFISAYVFPPSDEASGAAGGYEYGEWLPLDNPQGEFSAETAEVGLYFGISTGENTYLLPVLVLNGNITTVEGYEGKTCVIIDVVDWNKL